MESPIDSHEHVPGFNWRQYVKKHEQLPPEIVKNLDSIAELLDEKDIEEAFQRDRAANVEGNRIYGTNVPMYDDHHVLSMFEAARRKGIISQEEAANWYTKVGIAIEKERRSKKQKTGE